MPIYDYICQACGERSEVMHGVHAAGPEHCPRCGGGPMRKALHPPAIHFKGSGWAKKERAASPKPAATAATKADSTSDTASAAPGDAAPTKETASQPAKPAAAGKSEG